MWASWLIQPGQSLTNRPEQNFACGEVTNCVEPKGRRIVGHNESEGLKLRNQSQLHWAKVYTSPKPASLHALLGECDSDVPESQTMAGNSNVHIGTWESHIEASNKLKRQGGSMAIWQSDQVVLEA